VHISAAANNFLKFAYLCTSKCTKQHGHVAAAVMSWYIMHVAESQNNCHMTTE